MADSPGSTLSSIASDDMSDHEDLKPEHNQADSPSASSIMPPSKRRRTNAGALDHATPGSSHQEDNPPMSPSSSISSDTSGDIPNSPSIQALLGSGQDDEYSGHGGDQVTVCRWAGCEADDLGNLDALVQHIHEQHIATREKKFVCEWAGCPRNGQPHASGYALRAHMRSHTREKPFYCSLPECDRSFTRSDALAKHMRTVHETEALRPSDPVPKHQQSTPANKVQRIKLKLSQPKDDSEYPHTPTHSHLQNEPTAHPDEPTEPLEYSLPEFYGADIGFDDHELSLPPRELYRLLRRQIHWAEKEGQQLREEWEKIRPKRKEAWMEKEAIFDDVMDAEVQLLRHLSSMVGHDQYAFPKVQNQHQHQHQQYQQQAHGQQGESQPEQGQGRPEGVDVKPQVESGGIPSQF